jgi:hypothetical protein
VESLTEISGTYSSGFGISGGAPLADSFLVSGSILPVGLSFNATQNKISGSPTISGAFQFQLQILDQSGASVQSPLCSISVLAAPTLSCPASFAGLSLSYSSFVSVNGGVGSPYTFALAGGSLPPSLALGGTSGSVSGVANTIGLYNFTARAVDKVSGVAQAACSITVNAAPTIACLAQSVADVGAFYSSVAASGISRKVCVFVSGGFFFLFFFF